MSVSPEHVVVLAPGVMEENGLFADVQGGVYVGGQVRMDAAVQLAESDPSVRLTLVGGYDMDKGGLNRSQKVADMSRFILGHVTEARIDPVSSLPCTRHNLIAVLNKWAINSMKVEEVGILTNDYHLPRALEFAEHISSELGYDGSVRFTPISAEDLVGMTDEQRLARDQEESYLARLASEAKGLAELGSGQYVDSCLAKDLESLHADLAKYSRLTVASEHAILGAPLQKVGA